MRTDGRQSGAAGYAVAAALGLLALPALLPWAAITGSGDIWRMPPMDLGQNLTGHIAFQISSWGLPPLHVASLGWPEGASIGMTDSNPIVSLVAKVIAGVIGRPVNLFGLWLALCWVLQPIAAVYALRGFGARRPESMVAAAVLALLFPALLARAPHINLCAHFLILAALGLSVRMMRQARPASWRDWIAPFGLLTLSIAIHPYIYMFALALFGAPALQRLLVRPRAPIWAIAGYAGAAAVPVIVFVALNGPFGGSDFGFGFYSMNLGSPFWPQRSGVFGASLPILDANGGQYEGFNYLGAGSLLLLVVAIPVAWRSGGLAWRRWLPLLLVLLALTGIALSNQIYLGHIRIFAVESALLERLMGPVRASGRAFWPVGYALILWSVCALEQHLSRARLGALLAVAMVLQLVDTGPLRAELRTYWQGEPVADMPVGAPEDRLLTTTSHCAPSDRAETTIARLRLAAIRAGMMLADMRLSRPPASGGCEVQGSDALDLVLREGEVRAFVGEAAIGPFRRDALGPAAQCVADAHMILCRPGNGTASGPAGTPLATVAIPATGIAGAALRPLTGWGWHEDAEGRVWSNGPRATLLFGVAGLAEGARVRLTLDGVAKRPGGDSRVTLRAGANTWPPDAATPVEAKLRDLTPGEVDVAVPGEAIRHGMLRIVFDIPETVDPRTRTGAIPVRWAGIRLHALDLLPAP